MLALLLARAGCVAAQETATSVTGAVMDVTGTAVAGAHAELTRGDGTDIETSTSDATGTFSFVDDRTGDLLTHYLFASLFHQDPRYFYQGTGTTRSRMVHALSSAFVARSDSGKPMPNYAYVFGNISAASLSNTYYPTTARGADLILTNVAVGLAGRAAANLIQEFVGKRLTKKMKTAQVSR